MIRLLQRGFDRIVVRKLFYAVSVSAPRSRA
jgi:hypothetical protein